MKYAVERNNLLKEIRRLSLTDELTGLYNRGGFITCLEHEKKVIDRYGKSITVIYADIDNLKFINDHYGHHAGDRAIIATSQILKSFFRDSDILGRIGGDEFIAAVLQFKNADSSVITDHLVQKVDKFNAGGDLAYDLSVSFGYVTIDHKQLDNPWAAIEAAEAKMYINKKNRKSSR